MPNVQTLSVPGNQLLLTSDFHIGSPFLDNSTLGVIGINGVENIVSYARRNALPIVCAGDMQWDNNNADRLQQTVDYYTEFNVTMYQTIGNHDYDTDWWDNTGIPISGPTTGVPYLTDVIKAKQNIFPYGYHNIAGTGVPWFEETVGNVKIIGTHNIQDYDYSTSSAYPYVNPSGYGVAHYDWGGISVPASDQREFIRNSLQDAADKNLHVLLVGHRPTYGVADYDLRRNHTEALDETVESGYPKGWIIEVEDWCAANNRHVVFLNGDQHNFALTRPIYRGAVNNSHGIIHLNLSAGFPLRNADLADSSLHIGWAGLNTDNTYNYNMANSDMLPQTKSGSGSGGVQFFVHADFRSNKLILDLYASVFGPLIDSRYKVGGILVDSFEVNIRRGVLTGSLTRRNANQPILR